MQEFLHVFFVLLLMIAYSGEPEPDRESAQQKRMEPERYMEQLAKAQAEIDELQLSMAQAHKIHVQTVVTFEAICDGMDEIRNKIDEMDQEESD